MILYDDDNVFNKIIKGELETKKVYEDKFILAIYDHQPVADVHILVMPKGNYIDFDHFVNSASSELIIHYFKVVNLIIENLRLKEQGYRLITNRGEKAGQTVMHFHTHILSSADFKHLI